MVVRRVGARRAGAHDRDRRRRHRARARPAAGEARGDHRQFSGHLSVAPSHRLSGRRGMTEAAADDGFSRWLTPVRIALIVWAAMSLVAIVARWHAIATIELSDTDDAKIGRAHV